MNKLFKHFKVVCKHKWYVFLACYSFGIVWQGIIHDLSKFSIAEFYPSAKYFQGTKSPIAEMKEKLGYSYAWLHHKGHNKHHWEYYVDWKDGKELLVPIPFKYCLEVVADFIGTEKAYSNGQCDNSNPLGWWLSHFQDYRINEKSKQLIFHLLNLYSQNKLNLKKIKKIKKSYEDNLIWNNILYYGSFNPVHNSHIKIMEKAVKCTKASNFYFEVSNEKFYNKKGLIQAEKRLELIKLAIQKKKTGDTNLYLGLLSPKNQTHHITFREMAKLSTTYKDKSLNIEGSVFVIIGSDNLKMLKERFYNSLDKIKELLEENIIIVVGRNKINTQKYIENSDILKQYKNKFLCLSAVKSTPSSTEIREKLAVGLDCSKYLNKEELNEIKMFNLYRNNSELNYII